MQVFNAYFKIIKKNIPQMMIYLVVFISLSVVFVNVGVGQVSTAFVSTKPHIAVFVNGEETALVKGFRDYLGEIATIVPVENNENAIRDSLFFRKVTYILVIPEGFTDSILQNREIALERRTVPDSFDATYLDRRISQYLTSARACAAFIPDISQEQVVKQVREVLAAEAEITIKTFGVKTGTANNSVYYFNYFAYSLFAVILLGVSSFMLSFQNREIKKRNAASPVPLRSLNVQLVMGNILFALAAWVLMYGLSFVMFGKSAMTVRALYYAVNTLVYALVCVSISFLTGNLVQSRNAQAAVVNVLALGLSFISGVFVPQMFLGDTVLKIASFTPTYWYVRANLVIDGLDLSSGFRLSLISKELLVQLLFAAALFAVSGYFVRRRRTSES